MLQHIVLFDQNFIKFTRGHIVPPSFPHPTTENSLSLQALGKFATLKQSLFQTKSAPTLNFLTLCITFVKRIHNHATVFADLHKNNQLHILFAKTLFSNK